VLKIDILLWQTRGMPSILTLNGGSSSIRFAVYEAAAPPRKLLGGQMQRIGFADASLSVAAAGAEPPIHRKVEAADHGSAAKSLMDWLESQPLFAGVEAVGHRVVHGMLRTEPERVNPALMAELRKITPFDPEHLPREIELIEALLRRYPTLPQAVCFDTAFHRHMPRVATLLPIPRRYEAGGVRRYGFHGLSYTYLIEELARLGDPAATRGRVILAHLGNGASLAALRDGKSIDTSMGFTPSSGLVMSTRCGDLDPGLLSYLAQTEGMDGARLQTLVSHESGLLGVSESSSDIRDLLERESGDARAADAIALFCYQAKKWIGSFAAALGGLDTLVFSGGIGENAAAIRRRICDGLEFLGVTVDDARNRQNAGVISGKGARVAVRVIRTDEESVIARLTMRVLGVNGDEGGASATTG
jgi:acetate kinase